MKLKTLVEEFETSFKMGDNNTIEIFVNPTSKELKIVKKEFDNTARFTANNKTKKVYVFSSNIIHDDFFFKMKLGSLADEKTSDWFSGITYDENRFDSEFMEHIISRKPGLAKKVLSQNWNWVEKYLPGFNKWYKKEKIEWMKDL